MIQLSQNLSSIVSGAASVVKLTTASRGGRVAGVGLERLLQLNARCIGALEYFHFTQNFERAQGRVRQGCHPEHCDAFGVLRKKVNFSTFFDC